MGADTDTLADRLGRTRLEGDELEGERLRRALKASLLGEPADETRIDRFVVLGQLGAGGMGIVYAAYDPELDRKVAIKLVRTWGTQKRAADQQRLVREARALARLSHPNIVTVFEVGIHGDDVFVAMELVRGRSLREHLVGARWQDIVAAYAQAAEGLAAAHDAGLVHRDFKPDNAIVGADGRVRVVDFGIAGGEGSDLGARPSRVIQANDTPLTSTGSLLGTPAYMAPEQRLGLRVLPTSDQFSFCVALHEALCGQLPRTGADGIEYTSTLPASLPAALRRAVARGLSSQAEQRFPDMRALVRELRAPLSRGRRLRSFAVVVSAAGLAAVGARALASLGDDRCPDPAAELAGVWDDDARERLRARAGAVGGDVVDTLPVVERELDRYTDAWVEQRHALCEAFWVQHTESDEGFERRMGCLERRRYAIGDLLGLLELGDAATWRHAVEATLGLTPIESCAQSDEIVALPLEPERAAAVQEVRLAIDRVGTLARLDDFDAAIALAERTVDEALAIGHRASEAEALYVLANLEDAQQREDDAAPHIEDALWRAEAARDDQLTGLLLARAIVVSVARGRVEEAASYERRLAGALERIDRPTRLEMHVERSRSRLAKAQGQLEQAELHARAFVDAAVRYDGEGSQEHANALTNLGGMLYERGDYVGAGEALGAAQTILHALFGARHPNVLQGRINLAAVDERQGRFEQARAVLETVIADSTDAFAVPSPILSMALDNLANIELHAGRVVEARALIERSIAVLEASVGPDDPRLLTTLLLLGNVEEELGHTDEARAAYERMVASAERTNPHEPLVAYAWNNLSGLEIARGAPEQACELAARAVELWSRGHGPDHPVTAQMTYSLAMAELAAGRRAEAAAHARQAIPTLAAGGVVDADSLAGAQFVLARALANDPAAAGEAVAAAQAAVDVFVGLGDASSAAQVRTWLDERKKP